MKKILLVDDDKSLCELLSSYLFSCDFSVKSVNNTRNALALMKEDKPDLVISDIMMQDLNGYDLINLLNFNDYFLYIPVIFLTAKGMTHDRIKGYDLGCYAYLTKPFDPQELVAIIKSILSHIDLLTKASTFLSKTNDFNKYIAKYDSFYFTFREESVLKLVLKGYMNKEIAIMLNVGIRNVEKYVTRILKKTNVRNRIELIKLFISQGE
uniref:TctD-like protein n=1 Tax=Polysiphonia infestans TaxID=2006978 RepID=A0A1Z1MF20_9FLOR|nr:hypothetical protein [Polysiphonia infestans]ARW64452.1 hypothetical protein [Polysiphonia infestans]